METANGIPVIRKKGAMKHRDAKHTKLLYMTYVLNFPDGDQWVKQEPFSAHDLAFKLNNIIAEHRGTASDSSWVQRCNALWNAGECWWKDEANMEHLILIEDKKRTDLKWGVSKEDYMTIKTGLTEEQMKEGL